MCVALKFLLCVLCKSSSNSILCNKMLWKSWSLIVCNRWQWCSYMWACELSACALIQMCDKWLCLWQASLSDDCGFSSLIVLLVWRGISDSLIAYAWLLSCLPVTTCLWPDPTGDAVEEGELRCARRFHSENVLESPCPKTAPLPPNSAASLIIRHRCHTTEQEKAQYRTSKKQESKLVLTSIRTSYRGDTASAMCSAEQLQNQPGFSPTCLIWSTLDSFHLNLFFRRFLSLCIM